MHTMSTRRNEQPSKKQNIALTSPSVSLGISCRVSGSMILTFTPGIGTPTQPKRRFSHDTVPVKMICVIAT